MATEQLLTIANELYALPPNDFTAHRNALAKDARAEDKTLADAVKRLPKPSTAAWVVNMLARHRAAELDQVLELGAALRQAQESMDGAALRDLNRQRRQLTAAVTSRARGLAHDLGVRISDTVAGQVEETLRAAMTDQGAATAVRTGQLVEALSATGIGTVDLSTAVAIPDVVGGTATSVEHKQPALTVVAAPAEPDDEAREAAHRVAAEAEAAAAATQRKLDKAQKRVAKLEARTLQLQGELEEVRRLASELEFELERVDDALSSAEEKRDRARVKHATAAATLAHLPK